MNKKQKNTAVPKTKFQKILTWRWYIKALVILVIIFTGFQVFKFGMNTYNISLLDKAEAKMRALNVPKADYGEYRRSCSFRSVKFGGAGSPNCRVLETGVYSNKDETEILNVVMQYLAEIQRDYSSAEPNFSSKTGLQQVFQSTTTEQVATIENIQYQKGVDCYINFTTFRGDATSAKFDKNIASEKSDSLRVVSSCYRRFMFQTYPDL